jgi:hypothetical protein
LRLCVAFFSETTVDLEFLSLLILLVRKELNAEAQRRGDAERKEKNKKE